MQRFLSFTPQKKYKAICKGDGNMTEIPKSPFTGGRCVSAAIKEVIGGGGVEKAAALRS